MIETKLLLWLGRRLIFKIKFVPPKLHRMLVFVLEEWHSSVLLFLPPCSRCVETTSWALKFPLFISVFSSFLLTLSGALCEYKCLPPGLLFFPRFVFLWKWLRHRTGCCPLLGWGLQSEVCPEARGSARRTKLLCQIWIWPSVEEEVCISRHMRLQSPPFPSSVTAKGGKFVSTLSLTAKPNGCKMAPSTVLRSCSCGNIIHVFIRPSLKVDHLQLGNLFPAALWRTWMFLGVLDRSHHGS